MLSFNQAKSAVRGRPVRKPDLADRQRAEMIVQLRGNQHPLEGPASQRHTGALPEPPSAIPNRAVTRVHDRSQATTWRLFGFRTGACAGDHDDPGRDYFAQRQRWAARIVDVDLRNSAGDIQYARSLAVVNGSNYRLTFDTVLNQYVLTYSGTNPALATLPPSPFHTSSDTPTQQVVRLADLPHVGPP